jgi:hypothetical protein
MQLSSTLKLTIFIKGWIFAMDTKAQIYKIIKDGYIKGIPNKEILKQLLEIDWCDIKTESRLSQIAKVLKDQGDIPRIKPNRVKKRKKLKKTIRVKGVKSSDENEFVRITRKRTNPHQLFYWEEPIPFESYYTFDELEHLSFSMILGYGSESHIPSQEQFSFLHI